MGVYEEAKARITSLQCRVQRVYEAGEALGNDSSNKLAKTKFKIMFATIENLYSDFETQLMVIIRHQCKSTPVVDAIDTDSVRALFEEKYIGCKIFADEYLPEAVVDDSLNKTFFESKALSASQPYHPIEKLAVPKFGGNPMEYTSFRNMFDKLVGESNMSPVVKFGYLKSYLVGEPLSLVSNLMLTDSNYELALAQLTDRYSNRRVIADSHIEALFNAPRATFGDGSSIRKLLNVILESTGALQNLSYAVDQWDPILLHLLQKKLDNYLRAQWELLVDTSEDPSMKEFTTFLTKYCKSATVSQGSVKVTTKGLKPNKSITLFSSQPERKLEQGRKNKSFSCPVCNTQPGHLLINCQSFKDKTPTERHQTIKELKRCFICFSAHMASECKNQRNCSTCGGKHHTLLHLEKTEPNVTTTHLTVAAAETKGYHTSVLLATASVVLQNKNGQSVTVRALLDSASQSSFVTERCVQLLGLKREKCDVTVQALSGAEVPAVRGRANVEVRPVDQQSPMFSIDVLILTRITGPVPSKRVWNHSWPHIKGLKLADPSFAEALPVDVLLGADVFPQLLLGDKEEGEVDEPIALSTVFGWVLMGKTTNGPKQQIITLCSSESVNHTLQQFFEIEEVPKVEKNNPADLECEQIYQTTTTRQQDGRYIVHLPFTRNPPLLGKSRDVALHRLRSLENKFKKSPELHKEYNMAMYDYLETGHMSAVVKKSDGEENMYYIPHQAVLRPESTTTKLRVVFDASAKTSSGHSLNDNLYCGQRLQQDLPGIVLRFRLHSVVFTADVKQMFRQIVVTEAHRPYQRLLYRFSLDEPVQEYQMNTVTFGQKSSPFLAIRTLHQLATDEAVNEPLVQTVVKRDLYVDDIATGAESEEAAIDLQKKLENTFAKGHFELRKWSSNSDKLLSNIPLDHQQTLPVTFEEHELTYTKVLGLNWDPKVDSLSYKYQPNPVKYSKRAILSEIARIYDPLGLLAPVTTVLKRLIKYLWVLKVDWDDIIPEDAKYAWQQYHQELPILATLRVPRLVTSPNALYELHGFSDSSEAAYAAVVYLRVCTSDRIGCHLLMGKAKISPTTKMSIPRLELCGAWLLAHLLDYVSKNLKSLSIGTVTAWTDSTVALAWIKSPTSRLKTFVANRVAQIQLLTKGYTWRHVPTEENPADCASRGLSPQQLTNHDLWWKGPTFLCQPKNTWPAQNADSPDSRLEEEAEEKPITLISQVKEEESRLLYQSDNLQKILRLTAYWLRVGDHLLGKPSACIFPPTVAETERSLRSLIRWTQRVFFADIKKAIATDKQVPASVRKLSPFLDEKSLIRVGGRLKNSPIPYDEKYPILLPKNSKLTELLIDFVHRTKSHPGAQTTHNILRQNYWILSARSIIRKRIHQCIPCFRVKPRPNPPLMGNLPVFRVTQVKPFSRAGVDFAGPFQVKAAMLRKIKVTKAYLCIFVCMVTTAVHIELVSDMSTPLFIAALNRFISRRGRCTDIYSDCGTNFVGSQRYLKEVDTIIRESKFVHHVISTQIHWHFNPPAAPHMGGLWEAAVKSAKTLLHRVVQDRILTYEELNTVLHQVEAVLNSRPLCTMSSDPNDFTTLTAGHFLTMEPLVAVPSPQDEISQTHISTHKRWSLIQQIHQHFWSRWKHEYLHKLQEKTKWNRQVSNLKIGDLVILQEPTPPLTWSTARVVDTVSGTDGVVRVAQIRTSAGKILRRPAVKLCPLPSNV